MSESDKEGQEKDEDENEGQERSNKEVGFQIVQNTTDKETDSDTELNFEGMFEADTEAEEQLLNQMDSILSGARNRQEREVSALELIAEAVINTVEAVNNVNKTLNRMERHLVDEEEQKYVDEDNLREGDHFNKKNADFEGEDPHKED